MYKQVIIRDNPVLLLHKPHVKPWLSSPAFLYNNVTKMWLIKMPSETDSQLLAAGPSPMYSPGREDVDDVLGTSPEVSCSLLGEQNL